MSTTPLPVVACVPVQAMPDFPARATYAAYVQVPCPSCNELMWLGERGKRACAAGLATMLCMVCALQQHGVAAVAAMGKLTDLDR